MNFYANNLINTYWSKQTCDISRTDEPVWTIL